MGVVDLDDEIGHRQLQLVHPELPCFGFRRKTMAVAKEQQDVGGLADDAAAGLEERRREGRRVAVRLQHRRHRGDALLARDVAIGCAGLLQREPHIFAAALDHRPVIQLVAHGPSSI